MGNTCSIELYKWLSVEFPEEFALIYPKDKSKYSIFHLSINLERVLLRLANALCDDYLVQLLHMEVTGESDNNGSFNLGLVRVVADGITPEQTVRDTEHFDHLCGTKSCFYAVMRKGGNANVGSEEKMTWGVLHSYNISLTIHVKYYVNIKCDKVRGLRAKFRGLFVLSICQSSILVLTQKHKRSTLIGLPTNKLSLTS
ncbi:hypothetical protein JHK84_049560 [Glycine max]|nr:hypothetical protein JHK84_049560 [Glycine max]